MTLTEKFKRAATRMIRPGEKVLAAVSGGADSVALLYLLNDLKEKYKFQLSVAHLDHNTREGASREDAEFVRQLSERLGLDCYIDNIDDVVGEKPSGGSFQENARRARYKFFEALLKQMGGGRVALGHNADDQVETVLLHLLRGSGTSGLSGMPESRESVIRPLLGFYRSEILAYLKERGAEYREDASNQETSYLRNRVRHQLIPELKTYNPRLNEVLLNSAAILGEENRYLDILAQGRFASLFNRIKGGSTCFLDDFLGEPKAIKRRLIRLAFQAAANHLRILNANHVQAVLDLLLRSPVGKRMDLPDGVQVAVGYSEFEIRRTDSVAPAILTTEPKTDFTAWLKVPGSVAVEQVGLEFVAEIVAQMPEPDSQDNPHRGFFDLDKVGSRIGIRSLQAGDRFRPLGMRGHKKLKAYLGDEKVPRNKRNSIPILTSETGDIIWVYGMRIGDDFRVTKETRRIVAVEGLPQRSE